MSVLAGANILVSGATHTGKTTMLNALVSGARTGDRVVTVEGWDHSAVTVGASRSPRDDE